MNELKGLSEQVIKEIEKLGYEVNRIGKMNGHWVHIVNGRQQTMIPIVHGEATILVGHIMFGPNLATINDEELFEYADPEFPENFISRITEIEIEKWTKNSKNLQKN
jgi:hypothetical protein